MRTEKQIINALIENQTEALIELRIKEKYLNNKVISDSNQNIMLELGRIQNAIRGGEDFLEFLKKQ